MKSALFVCAFLLFASISNALTPNERTICGSDDMEDMIGLNDDMKSMGMPIGILDVGGGLCSGTLISKDLFLTAGHCSGTCKNMKVTFGFLNNRKESFGCKDIVEVDDSGAQNRDYMVLRLEGSPGVQWGWYDMSDKEPTAKTPLLIIHHPEGLPMKVSRKNCFAENVSGGMVYHSCDTNPGTSGSGIIVPDYQKPENSRIVAIHAYGGCNASSTKYNSGASIKNLLSVSPTIKAMVK